MNKSKQDLATALQTMHLKGNLPTDQELDQLIGIKPNRINGERCLTELIVDYGPLHRIYQADTTYTYIQRLFDFLTSTSAKPTSFLDIGSGNGRILFYGALLLPNTKFYGIEMVQERVEHCHILNRKLGLNIKFINGDVLKEELPSVECICLINSLFPVLMPELIKKLERYAQSNPFTLISASTCNVIISEQDWIQEVDMDPPPANELDLRIFKTV